MKFSGTFLVLTAYIVQTVISSILYTWMKRKCKIGHDTNFKLYFRYFTSLFAMIGGGWFEITHLWNDKCRVIDVTLQDHLISCWVIVFLVWKIKLNCIFNLKNIMNVGKTCLPSENDYHKSWIIIFLFCAFWSSYSINNAWLFITQNRSVH